MLRKLSLRKNKEQKNIQSKEEEGKGIFKKVPLMKRNAEEKFQGDRGFTYPFGYQEEDAYLFVGHKLVISVFDVLIQYGTNNPASVGWLLNLIPREELESGRVIFVQRQKGMKKDTEYEIVEKHIESNIETINASSSGSAKENAQNASRVQDMGLSGYLAGEGDNIVDSDV